MFYKKIKLKQNGFTLTEVIVVVAIMAIIATIAIPPFLQWQRNLAYRTTAREIASMLQDARNRTIHDNIQHRVEISTPLRTRYRMTRGTQAIASPTFPTVVFPWVTIRQDVSLVTGGGIANDPAIPADVIEFQPNGSSEVSATIQIQDTTPTTRFTVRVDNTGRVVVQ